MHIKQRLQQRYQAENIRQLQVLPHLVDFSSNDYLGLARSSNLKTLVFQEWEKPKTQVQRTGLGSTGSRLLTGNSHYAEDLENSIASFHGYEAGLLFNCGYMANVGLLSTVASRGDILFFDSGIHASAHDGIRLSGANAFPFRHNNLEHLENRLKSISAQKDRFICIESVYSTDGSMAPLSEIVRLAQKYEAHLIVDEAHAVGVFGPEGRGLVAEHELTTKIFAQVTTFGKALAAHGAIVLGSRLLKQALINFATPFIYTTALPFLTLASIKCSYDVFPKLDLERRHLLQLIEVIQKNDSAASSSPIQSIAIPGNKAVKQAAAELVKAGFDVRPLTSPTVQRGHEILRICLHAFNSESELTSLLRKIRNYE